MREVTKRLNRLAAKKLDDRLTSSIRSLAAEGDTELDDASVQRLKGLIRAELGQRPSAMYHAGWLAWAVVVALDWVAPAGSSITLERRLKKVGMQLRGLDVGIAEWVRTTHPRQPSWEEADTPELDLLARAVAAYQNIPSSEKQLAALRVKLRDRIDSDPSLKWLRAFLRRKAKRRQEAAHIR